ncbi:discoidin domain-containing protein [Paenibacillus doosanensis]|uniref:F5/8 type C domain protein n=1 Tax=Paenibacillus konkukensis TaxID=2020716 RepID=A0ABY4RNX2_9BACL|nr:MULTISPECIES: discoidin domain-containing protein [Paenibacillus]MCS7464974.1 discoidin domain-containing protein [Paenibacillus doosanensis]UQZ83531.1 F5/8 type C domain protein [Paenibacillus konkukensis]
MPSKRKTLILRLRSKSLSLSVIFLLCFTLVPLFTVSTAFAATTTVPAGDVAALRSALASAQPGDIIEVSGTYSISDGTISTSVSGSANNYITLRGTGSGATLNYTASAGNAAFYIKNNYYKMENITINSNSNSNKGLLIEASHGYITNVTVKNTKAEGFKIRKNSQYWLLTNCLAQYTGQSGKYGEGYYVGDADQNWTTAPNADQSGYITFLNSNAFQTKNDGFDFKEGTHHIKVIGADIDFNNTVPESTVGNNGLFIRANNVQVINTTIKNNAGTGQAVRGNKMTASDGNSYGSNLEMKALSGVNLAGALIYTSFTNNKLFTDYSMTSVSGGLYASGSNTATSASPSSFTEMTWSGEGGDVYGAGTAVNLALNKTASASTEWSSTYAAGKAVDGSTGTRWASASGTSAGQWLRVDLGSSQTYSKVVIKETNFANITSFKLQSSADGTNFSDIASGTTIGASKTITFSPVTSRYIRLYVVSASDEANVNEFEVYAN